MPTTITVLRLCTMWQSEEYEISTENEDKALEKAITYLKSGTLPKSGVGVEYETLEDTQEWVKVENNNGQATERIYLNQDLDEPRWSNA